MIRLPLQLIFEVTVEQPESFDDLILLHLAANSVSVVIS